MILNIGIKTKNFGTPIIYTPLIQLVNFLKNRGFMVKDRLKITGKSGIEHTVDLLAIKIDNGEEEKTLFEFFESKNEIDIKEIIKFYMKGYDINAKHLIVLACPKLSEEANKIANLCQMKVFESSNMESVLTKVLENF